MADRTIESRVADLTTLLLRQLELHRRLIACLERKREAIRSADVDAFEGLAEEEVGLIGQLETQEQQRRGLLVEVTTAMGGDAAAPMTVGQIAERVPEPLQGRLLATAAELRELVGALRRLSTVVRTAAEALSRHMAGVMHTMQSALGRARVYGRQGNLAGGSQMQFSVDLKT